MLSYFAERARGWRVVLPVLASFVWWQAALMLTGLYPRYAEAQGTPALEESPFFDAAAAAERLGAIHAANAEGVAYAVYGLDVVNALLIAAGLAALIGFGLRGLALERTGARWLLLAPLSLAVADLLENALLAVMLAAPDLTSILAGVAGVATGVKFGLFMFAAPLAAAGLLVGLGALARRRLLART